MKLLDLTDGNIKKILSIHDKEGGNLVNNSLTKLFSCMCEENSKYEVGIKVAALNQIYSTAIQYTKPVVEKIIEEIPNKPSTNNIQAYVGLVDKIATVSWVSKRSDKEVTRCNLSFASKYVHFLSNYSTPIYDSYIWIIIIGYLNQEKNEKYSFKNPENYSVFYEIFTKFKNDFNLVEYSNYDIDKFLWQYGKDLLNEIMKNENINLGKAKTFLRKSILSE